MNSKTAIPFFIAVFGLWFTLHSSAADTAKADLTRVSILLELYKGFNYDDVEAVITESNLRVGWTGSRKMIIRGTRSDLEIIKRKVELRLGKDAIKSWQELPPAKEAPLNGSALA